MQDILEQTFQKTKGPQSLYVNPLHAGEHSGLNYQQYSSIFFISTIITIEVDHCVCWKVRQQGR